MAQVNTRMARFIKSFNYNELPSDEGVDAAEETLNNPYLGSILFIAQASKMLYRAELAIISTVLLMSLLASCTGLVMPVWMMTIAIFALVVMIYADHRYNSYRDELQIELNKADIIMACTFTLEELRLTGEL